MKKLELVISFFIIIALASKTRVNASAGLPVVKAVILFAFDEAAVESSIVSMAVDKTTLMKIIADSQLKAKVRSQKLGDNGLFAFLEGESSSFSFATSKSLANCDCNCLKQETTTPPRTTVLTTTPFVPSTYLPPISITTTPWTTVTTPPTKSSSTVRTTPRTSITTTPWTTATTPSTNETPLTTFHRTTTTTHRTTPTKFTGPPYLPLVTKETSTRRPYTPYTSGTFISSIFKRNFNLTQVTWPMYSRRPTISWTTTRSPRYVNSIPNNTLSYLGEDNSV